MASHGKHRHLKRLAAPKMQPIHRKAHVWLLNINPGPHAKQMAIPLGVALRDILGLTTTGQETRKLLKSGDVLVDGRKTSDDKFPVGLMDVIFITKLNAGFTLLNKKGKFISAKADKKDSKLAKITGKRLIAGGKIQLTLHDGRNIVIPNTEKAGKSGKEEKEGKSGKGSNDSYAVGDTLRISLPTQKIMQHLPLQKGAHCYVFQGRHAGSIGTLQEIIEFEGITRSNARIITPHGEQITLKDYVFVVDGDFKI